jgi:hypothetical protein
MLRIKNNLGNKIKRYRKKLKITQKTLANMFKVNIEVIKTIEDTYWSDTLYYHLSLMEKIEYYLLEIIKDNEKE